MEGASNRPFILFAPGLAMKLHSLKQTGSEWEEPAYSDKDEYYPSIFLSEKTLETMGIENPRVGTEMTMVATVRVSSVNESKGGHRSMSFEIIEAAVSPKESDVDPSKVLFPNG